MDRTLRILTGGWLDNSTSLLTRGYFNGTAVEVITGVVNLTLRSRSVALTLIERSTALTLRARDNGLSLIERSTGLTLRDRSVDLTLRDREK